MDVYRISKREYAAPDGMGGLLYAGRWHKAGYRVVYAAHSRSLAALEYLVHLNAASIMLNDFVITTLFIPNQIVIEELDRGLLPDDWANISHYGITQKLGTGFLKKAEHLVLRVPSAIVPDECNYIINPAHPQMAMCKVKRVDEFRFDSRLLKAGK